MALAVNRRVQDGHKNEFWVQGQLCQKKKKKKEKKRPGVAFKAQKMLLFRGNIKSSLTALSLAHYKQVAKAFCLSQTTACSLPNLHQQIFSACGLTMAVCSLWPSLQLCQPVQKVSSGCRSAVTDATAV